MHIAKEAPVADGIWFCDGTYLDLGPNATRMLAARGLLYATEFQANGLPYGGTVIASNWEHAAEIADARGLGEKVVGAIAFVGE